MCLECYHMMASLVHISQVWILPGLNKDRESERASDRPSDRLTHNGDILLEVVLMICSFYGIMLWHTAKVHTNMNICLSVMKV